MPSFRLQTPPDFAFPFTDAHTELRTAQLLLWKARLEQRMQRRRRNVHRIEAELDRAWGTLEQCKEEEPDMDNGFLREMEQYFRGMRQSLSA